MLENMIKIFKNEEIITVLNQQNHLICCTNNQKEALMKIRNSLSLNNPFSVEKAASFYTGDMVSINNYGLIVPGEKYTIKNIRKIYSFIFDGIYEQAFIIDLIGEKTVIYNYGEMNSLNSDWVMKWGFINEY